jgi:hypothetical protein
VAVLCIEGKNEKMKKGENEKMKQLKNERGIRTARH